MGCLPRRRRQTVQPDSGEVLLVGCEGSGKTLLSRHLQKLCSTSANAELNTHTRPSIGTEIAHLTHLRRAFSLREVGGVMLPLWPRYFDACKAFVFVADSSNTAATGSAVIEWYNLLAANGLRAKPGLLLLNKRDDSEALPDGTLNMLFRMSDLARAGQERVLRVLPVSAMTGEGLSAVLDWMAQQVG